MAAVTVVKPCLQPQAPIGTFSSSGAMPVRVLDMVSRAKHALKVAIQHPNRQSTTAGKHPFQALSETGTME